MPGFPAKQSFGRVGKGGGFFQQRDFSGFIRGNLFLPLIVHPHPGPLPSREREKYVEASTPSVISEISSRGSKDFKYRGPLIKAFRNDGHGGVFPLGYFCSLSFIFCFFGGYKGVYPLIVDRVFRNVGRGLDSGA